MGNTMYFTIKFPDGAHYRLGSTVAKGIGLIGYTKTTVSRYTDKNPGYWGTASIALLENWPAYEFGVSGLVVCRKYTTGSVSGYSSLWEVVHAESGLVVATRFKTRGIAAKRGMMLAGVVDWTMTRDEIVQAQTTNPKIATHYFNVLVDESP